MILKGIRKGDSSYRHFTIDDSKYTIRDGAVLYEVNYGKDKLEGPDAEDQVAYIPYEQIIVLGGKKLSPPVEDTPVPVISQKEQPQEQKKRGRPSKKDTQKAETISPTYSGTNDTNTSGNVYEYLVSEIHSNDVKELQDKLNEAGSKGWELCGFDTSKSLFSDIYMIVILKRKRG